jgi:lysozyme
MNGIDISGWQPDINLEKVPCDFVIIKATQGISFISKVWKKQIEQALSLGKYVGVYHYANGAGVDVEADHFIDVVRPYLGKVILCVDWENNKKDGKNDNPMFVAGNYKYCEQLLVAIEKKTGIKPFLYMSKTVARQYKWEVGRNFPFWCAQYANKNPCYGYKDNPWTDNKGFGAWNNCKIFQYTSVGILPGYNKDLDLDIAYMTPNEWLAWASYEVKTDIQPVLKKGDRNEYVRSWQTYLNANGYQCGDADGIFGDKTEKAVIKWQQDHGMESGYIGPQTWNTLERGNK